MSISILGISRDSIIASDLPTGSNVIRVWDQMSLDQESKTGGDATFQQLTIIVPPNVIEVSLAPGYILAPRIGMRVTNYSSEDHKVRETRSIFFDRPIGPEIHCETLTQFEWAVRRS